MFVPFFVTVAVPVPLRRVTEGVPQVPAPPPDCEKAIVVVASPDAGILIDEAVGVSVTTAASAQANVHVAVVE